MFSSAAMRRSDPKEALKEEAQRAAEGKADPLTLFVQTEIAPGGKLFAQLQRFAEARRRNAEPPAFTEVRPVRREPTE